MKKITYFSITTPKSKGGIGLVELFGDNVLRIIKNIFQPLKSKNIAIQPNHLYLGYLYNNIYPIRTIRNCVSKEVIVKNNFNNIVANKTRKIDEVLIHFIPAKESLTGLDTIEINAHGGIMSYRIIGNLLKKLGVKEIFQNEVIKLAYKRGSIDIIQKEALENLLNIQTSLGSMILLDQYMGSLSIALKSRKNLSGLLKSSLYGIAMTYPKRILIIGNPNIGKSTLFNAIIGKERAIIHYTAGTTRDTIEENVSIKGFSFILIDTAGLNMTSKNSNDDIEREGMVFTKREISKADVILLVIGVNKMNLSEDLFNVLKRLNNFPVIIVLNKIDKQHKLQIPNDKSRTFNSFIGISALKRIGIEELKEEILRVCGMDKFRYKSNEPIIFTPRQYSLIKNRFFHYRKDTKRNFSPLTKHNLPLRRILLDAIEKMGKNYENN